MNNHLFFGGIWNGEYHNVPIENKTWKVIYVGHDRDGRMITLADYYIFKEIGFFLSHTTN